MHVLACSVCALQVVDEMTTDLHTKMEFVEFLVSLGIVAEMRILNGKRAASRQSKADAEGDDAGNAGSLEAKGEAEGQSYMDREPEAPFVVMSSHPEFITELQYVIAAVCAVATMDVEVRNWSKVTAEIASEVSPGAAAARPGSQATPGIRHTTSSRAGVKAKE